MTTLRRRIEALEAASNPVDPLVLILVGSDAIGSRPPVLRAVVRGRAMVQGDDETEAAFHARLRAAARQGPGQGVVLLDESDLEL